MDSCGLFTKMNKLNNANIMEYLKIKTYSITDFAQVNVTRILVFVIGIYIDYTELKWMHDVVGTCCSVFDILFVNFSSAYFETLHKL